MSDFEERVRAAFEQELAGNKPGSDLRERVIRRAVESDRGAVVSLPVRGRRPWQSPSRWMQVTALAAALVLVAGGLYVREAFNRSGAAVKATPSATVSGPRQAFGKLPAPGLQIPAGGFGGGSGGQLLSGGPPPYYGPTNLSWAGKFPSLPSNAPVYRYPVSDPAAYDAFAAKLGAIAAQGLPEFGPAVRQYRGPGDFDLAIGPSAILGQPVDTSGLPLFELVYSPTAAALPSRQPPLSDSAAQAAAANFLAKYGLMPSWPSHVSVAPYWSSSLEEPVYVVRYQRLVDLGGGSRAGLVDGQGQPFGLRVDVAAGGAVVRVTGLPPASEQPAAYPLDGERAAVQHALAAPPAAPIPPSSVPTVALTQVHIVYTGVVRGEYVYLEPAYLFTGVFRQAGIPQQKVVLVPAVASADIQ
jgi:hypothetical protein